MVWLVYRAVLARCTMTMTAIHRSVYIDSKLNTMSSIEREPQSTDKMRRLTLKAKFERLGQMKLLRKFSKFWPRLLNCTLEVGLHIFKRTLGLVFYTTTIDWWDIISFENPWKPCARGESEKAEFNEFGIKRSFAHTTINSFQDSITSSYRYDVIMTSLSYISH